MKEVFIRKPNLRQIRSARKTEAYSLGEPTLSFLSQKFSTVSTSAALIKKKAGHRREGGRGRRRNWSNAKGQGGTREESERRKEG